MSEKTTRRRCLLALGAVGAGGLAGCAEFDGGSGGGESDDDDEETETATGEGTENGSDEAEATLRQYLEAFGEDESTLESLTHPESQLSTEPRETTLTVREIAPQTLSGRAETLTNELTDEEIDDAREALEGDVERIGAEEYTTLGFEIETDSGERDTSVALLVEDDGQWYVYTLSVDTYLYSAEDHGGAEETGQQSSDQVTNRLEVVNIVGTEISDGTIGSVEIVVKKAPGANNIDLSTTTAQFVHSSGSTDLAFGSTGGSGSASEFGVRSIQDEDGSLQGDSPTLNDPADRAQLVLNTGAIVSERGGLGEGDTATVRFNTQSGGTTEARLVVPETLSGSEAVAL